MKEKTGYPSKDRPWEKYYKSTPSKDLSKYNRVYEMIFYSNSMVDDAIGFLDGECNWTFRKLKKTTDKCMDALRKNGVDKGDTILLGTTNTPEMVALVIAIISIGAIVKLFDIRASKTDIREYVISDNRKIVIVMDQLVLPKIDSILHETCIE